MDAWIKARVTVSPSGCWEWQGHRSRTGYARTSVGSRKGVEAHRVVYERLRGQIPDGLVLDHLCRVRHCVNPDHLEPVTFAENVLRGEGISAINARKTHCKNGHEFTEANTHRLADGKRVCRACNREAQRRCAARRAGGEG